ncbi:MAG: PQQ-binding-like beta-propeller repeat protein [Phycisphaerae bacterium]|nr:PQQ-binding-like beta-propeller repeat protein [Phycisphaerae bacterium]
MNIRTSFNIAIACFVVSGFVSVGRAAENKVAGELLALSGVRGGLVVHLGCGGGEVTAGLRAGDNFIVHGLDADSVNVSAARKHIKSLGLYGRVSVRRWDEATLPYIDNMVNLVVCSDAGKVSAGEIMRVLAPGGTLCVKKDGAWTKTVKPRPAEIDEWTHYMHDPSNNAVAHDMVIAPPRRLQWDGGPKWTRSHEKMGGVSAMVSAGGRMFYIMDEGSLTSIQLPPRWRLVARDAFNGVVLWKRDIALWHPHLWPLKSGPAKLPRRLVAIGDRVYVTLGIEAPVVALDAATGKTLLNFEGTAGSEGIIVSDGVLFANVIAGLKADVFKPKDPFVWHEAYRAREIGKWTAGARKQYIAACDTKTGRQLWKKDYPVALLTMAVDAKGVYFCDGQKVICLDRKNGSKRWESKPVGNATRLISSVAPTLVVYKDIVFSLIGQSLVALDGANGEELWRDKRHPRSGHVSPGDVLVVNDLVWSGGSGSGPFVGKNLRTGKIESSFTPPKMTWFHPRCYRSKATDKYILASRTGIEFADVREKTVDVNHWTRGGCVYGILPANGLIYNPPHPCACLLETKTSGFNALAPALAKPLTEPTADKRLVKGPAFGKVSNPKSQIPNPKSEDWPTYRRNIRRSGYINCEVPAKLDTLWRTKPMGRLSPLVSAGGRVYAVAKDAHAIIALDGATGKKLWDFTAGGPVDSPPTIYGGSVIFGSRDGSVYCLRAADGALAWRFLAAPVDRMLMSYGKLESVWPVSGSVLVRDNQAYFVAGRSAFLDGGMRLYRLDARSGKMLSMTVMNEKDPESGRNLQKLQGGWIGLTMPTALPDILTGDAEHIYMRSQPFDLKGKRTRVAPDLDVANQGRPGAHLFSPVGFLDDTWMHRTYWMLGVTGVYGWHVWFDGARYAPSGRIMSFDDSKVYSFARRPEHFAQSPVIKYHLYAADKKPDPEGPARVKATAKDISSKATDGRQRHEADKANWKARKRYTPKQLSAVKFHWRRDDAGLMARAMVLTKNVLFIAGPPDFADEEGLWNNPDDASLKARLVKQAAAWDGKHGAMLHAVNPADGKTLAEYKLDSLPVFDGMISAGGRLLIALNDGTIVCMGPSHIMREREVPVRLPDAGLKRKPDTSPRLVIDVKANGQYMLRGKGMTLAELSAALAASAKDNPKQRILVRGSRETNYQAVARVFEACKAAGIRQVGISVMLDPTSK